MTDHRSRLGGSGRVRYERCRFSTALPKNRLYTAAHYYLLGEEGLWRVGFTSFATRMLGEPVALDFDIEPGSRIETGQVIGSLEGFKAVSDIHTPLSGRFEGVNPDLEKEIQLLDTDPLERGWLFQVRGNPDDDCLDVYGYISVLDATLDRMLGKCGESPGGEVH